MNDELAQVAKRREGDGAFRVGVAEVEVVKNKLLESAEGRQQRTELRVWHAYPTGDVGAACEGEVRDAVEGGLNIWNKTLISDEYSVASRFTESKSKISHSSVMYVLSRNRSSD